MTTYNTVNWNEFKALREATKNLSSGTTLLAESDFSENNIFSVQPNSVNAFESDGTPAYISWTYDSSAKTVTVTNSGSSKTGCKIIVL